ncbi:MAG: M6 family metalloprotease domain-containing protein [candidate division Zixibacteria bacterium]|nr:M6 family metalloprotease domain-containing protein [candidate division Zixibacteria bacterium]
MCFWIRKFICSVCLAWLSLAFGADLWAVSLSPELVERLRAEGRLEEWIGRADLARQKGVWQPNPIPPLRKGGKMGQVDTTKAIVILVDFNDNQHSRTTGEFDTLLFSKGFVVSTGSMRDFYWENSYQTFELIGDVAGWFRMPQDYSYYTYGESGFGPYPNNAQRMVEDAVNAADSVVNFADYDGDGNGFVDALFVVHSGLGAEETGSGWQIWSHRWVTSEYVFLDGVIVYDYSTEPEIRIGTGLVDMGVFCHEFGHVLGLPDFYDYDYSSEGLGDWTLMAGGSWNNSGRTPAHFDAWGKKTLGWTTVNVVTSNQTDVEILQAETAPFCYRLWTSGSLGDEYFLVENRQKTGFDRYIPGHGLLIYHVDENTFGNSHEWCPGDSPVEHYMVALEQADGQFELEGCYGYGNQGDSRDPFPGTWDKRAFDDTTGTSSRHYSDSSTQVAVWNVSDSDSVMYANLDVTWSRPCLLLDEFTMDDLAGGNGNGRPEEGETVRLYFTVSNIWLPLDGASVTASADAAGITFTDDYAYLGDIETGGSADNYSDPLEFVVDSLFVAKPVIFTLHVEGNVGSYSHDFSVRVAVGTARILIADDDSGSAEDYLSYYTAALDSLNYIYDVWDTQNKGEPDFSFNDYRYLIWFTGDHKTSMFNQAQVESLMSFLDNGGGLFLTSQDAAEILSGSINPWDTLFLRDYLHVSYAGDCSRHLVGAYPGDEVGDDLWIFPGNTPGANNQTSKDNLVPDSLADTVLVYAEIGFVPTDSVAATKFAGDYKVVFFGFGFEAINSSGDYFHGHWLSKPDLVMQKVLAWLKTPLHYVAGDADGNQTVNAGDIVYLINYLFRDGPAPDPLEAGDANGNCVLEAGDIVYLISYLFRGGPPPEPGCA